MRQDERSDRTTPGTANERLKASFRDRFWGSMILATALHFALFAAFPRLSAADFSYSADEMEHIVLPPVVDPPAPPEELARPARPVVTDAVVDEDLTLPVNVFDSVPVTALRPPPEEGEGELREGPVLTPWTVPPTVTNRDEVTRALEREYPSMLRDAGIGGTVLVWFFIDEEGQVRETRIHETSGYQQFDQAALDVADIMRFTPAQNRDKRVPVWISLPIRFQVH